MLQEIVTQKERTLEREQKKKVPQDLLLQQARVLKQQQEMLEPVALEDEERSNQDALRRTNCGW
jgi:hypothetical protein